MRMKRPSGIRKRVVVYGLAGVFIWWIFFFNKLAYLPPNVLAPDDPVQTQLDNRQKQAFDDEYDLYKFARFELTALVLAEKKYRWDGSSHLSPVDLALGWGPMSSGAVLKRLKISQGGRFYFYRYPADTPIAPHLIAKNSSNMHMIPANKKVRKALMKLRAGDVVEIKGHLVDVSGPRGWRWKSSRTRKDTGKGACEVVYVDSVKRVHGFWELARSGKNSKLEK